MQTYPIILGTAGHIDHGKTSLVRELTGIDTDRLKVEKERGITTELGFAHLDLDGRRFGLVDVPGHERFIKAMVAGAGGLDLVCLVIAADEGIMPQTREHLDVCELLGIRLGAIVLSKTDLVDKDWLALVTDDIREELTDSFLAEAPIVPVSVKTGQGLDQLRKTLVALTNGLPSRSAEGRFRLPVDRVFSVKGFGTVITGTVISGCAEVGDDVTCAPGNISGKIRGLEVHGEAQKRARAGMRCAINLAGVGVNEVERGDVVVHGGDIECSHLIDVRFRYLRTSTKALKTRTKVLVHHGTTQRMATLVLVDRTELEPGGECLAQLRLDVMEPLVALPGDRFIVRGFVVQAHYGTTIGGGEIIRVLAPKARKSASAANQLLSEMATADAEARLGLEIKSAQYAGRTYEELAKRTGWPKRDLGANLQRLVEHDTIVRAGQGKLAAYMHVEAMAKLEKIALDIVRSFHEAHPEERGISRAELSAKLPHSVPPLLMELLFETLTRQKAVEIDRDVVRRPGHGAASKAGLSELEALVERNFLDWGNTPERPKDVPTHLQVAAEDVHKAMQRLLTLGRLIKVTSDLYLHRDCLDALREKLLAHFGNGPELSPAQWKEIVGASRKFTIPLAEFFDKEHITLRVGNVRKLRKSS